MDKQIAQDTSMCIVTFYYFIKDESVIKPAELSRILNRMVFVYFQIAFGGHVDLFWIWYKDLRPILHEQLVFDDKNNASQRRYSGLFQYYLR